jgi:hypothetical protein
MLPAVAEPMTRRPAGTLVVRARVTIVNGATGQAVATAQGQVLRALLLATLSTAGSTDQTDPKKAEGAAAQNEEIG